MNTPNAKLTFGEFSAEITPALVYSLEETAMKALMAEEKSSTMFTKMEGVRDLANLAKAMRDHRPTVISGGYGPSFTFVLDKEDLDRSTNLIDKLGREIGHDVLGGLMLTDVVVNVGGVDICIGVHKDFTQSEEPGIYRRQRNTDYRTTINGEEVYVNGSIDLERLTLASHVSSNVKQLKFTSCIHHQMAFVDVGAVRLREEDVQALAEDLHATVVLKEELDKRRRLLPKVWGTAPAPAAGFDHDARGPAVDN